MKKTLIFNLLILLTSWMQAAESATAPGHAFKKPVAASPSYGNHQLAIKSLTDCEASFETEAIDSLTLQFTAYFEAIDSAAAVSWDWDFGDGNTSGEENPAHTYDQAGIYEVTLTIVSATGCEASVTEHVWVGLPPASACESSFETEAIGSLILQFTAYFEATDSAAVVSWYWDFGDGDTSGEENPAHTYDQAGIYEVTLTIVSATGCEASTTEHVCVGGYDPSPDCSIEPYTDQTDTLTFAFYADYFAIDSAAAVSWYWDFGDGNTSTEENPVHTYDEAGYYEVTVVVSGDSGCEAEVTFPVFTDTPPSSDCEAYLDYEALDSLTYTFSVEVFGINGDSVGVLNYLWDFGDGTTSNEANPTHQFPEDGLYTVELSVVTEDSCHAYACAILVIDNGPVDTFYYGCQAMFFVSDVSSDSLTLTFEDLSFGGATDWYWEFGDGETSTEQNPVHTYTDPGVYVVELSIQTSTGCESNISFEICVKEDCPWQGEQDCQALFIPLPDSLGGLGFTFMDLSYSPNPILSWNWDYGDGNTSQEQSPYHTYDQPGVYNVTLRIEAQDCESEISFDLDIDEPWNFANNSVAALGVATGTLLGTKGYEPNMDALRLFPNPAASEVWLVFNAKIDQAYTISLKDLIGRTLQMSRKNATTGLNTAQLEVGNLLPGLYLLDVRTEKEVKTLKFIKQ